MDTNSIIHPEDSNNSWTFNFTASGFPEIDTEVAKAAPAADSIAMPPVDEDDELETAYDTTMLDCKRVAMRIARTWPDSGGMLAFNALFEPLPADKETRDWKWKLRWARRQLNNLEGIENDTAASHAAMGHAAASIAGAGRVAAGAEAAAATHSAMGQAAASIAGAGREAAGAEAEAEPIGQAATASTFRWRVLKEDDTMYEPPGPAHHVKHKKAKAGGV